MFDVNSKYDFLLANDTTGFKKAKELFIEYAESLNIDLCFQDFGKELQEIDIQYQKPTGGLILIIDKLTGEPIGCVGIRKYEDNIAELKRMYIKEDYRNQGLGKHLLIRAIGLAKYLGYEKIRLDTFEFMQAAIKLYGKYGFREIEPYRYNPGKDVVYFELDLKSNTHL